MLAIAHTCTYAHKRTLCMCTKIESHLRIFSCTCMHFAFAASPGFLTYNPMPLCRKCIDNQEPFVDIEPATYIQFTFPFGPKPGWPICLCLSPGLAPILCLHKRAPLITAHGHTATAFWPPKNTGLKCERKGYGNWTASGWLSALIAGGFHSIMMNCRRTLGSVCPICGIFDTCILLFD